MVPIRRDYFLLILPMLLLVSNATYAASHFIECVSRTGSNAHLLIPAGAVATFAGSPISEGDELAAYTNKGVCAGSLVWTSGAQALTIWGDDAFTDGQESFDSGDQIQLVFWDASTSREYPNVTVVLRTDLPFYKTELVYQKDALYLLEELSVDVDLQVPILEAPIATARAVDTSPLLRWTVVPDASAYEVQVAKNSDFDPVEQEYKSVGKNQLELDDLTEGTTYYWRVRSVKGGVTGEYVSSSFTTQFSQVLELVQGWNLISSRIAPAEAAVDDVYEGLESNLLMVKNGKGQMYSPEFKINTIGNWSTSQAYHVYATTSGTLKVKGDIVSPGTPLGLDRGWNSFAYWPTEPMAAPTALASIADDIVIVKNGAGQVWMPEFGVNTMGAMEPGSGYQVHMSTAKDLVYPAERSGKTSAGAESHAYSPQSAAIGSNATLLVLANDADGRRVLARRTNGAIIGEGVVDEGRAILILHGDDDITPDVEEGALSGEALLVEMQGTGTDELQIIEYRDLLSGQTYADLVYRADGVWVAEASVVEKAEVLPHEFQLEQNYPNPFNPSTTISYTIPEDARVRLEIFNVLGQRVALLVDEAQTANSYHLEFRADELPTGVYFYTITAGKYHAVRQMMLLK